MSDEPEPPTQAFRRRSPSSIGADQAEALFGLLSETPSQPDSPVDAGELRGAFPQYEILGLLGQGGMGVVYQARHKALDRRVAIKLLPPELGGNADFVARFQREARAMARLEHPNIISVYDFGQTPTGQPYFVMEFVDGANLADLIHSGAFIGDGGKRAVASSAGSDSALPSTLDPLVVAAQLCEALAYAHGEGIIHRDIKPANVLIDRRGRVKVADFGLARIIAAEIDASALTTTGTVMGTLDYMAPEQRKGMQVDQRADIYSLGVMLYEMLCGEVPHGVFEPPSTRVKCDPRIDAIVSTAMQNSPERRYQSTREMKAAVEELRAPSSKSAVPGAVQGAASEIKPDSHNRSYKVIAVVAMLLVFAGLAWWFVAGKRPAAAAGATSALRADQSVATPASIKLWDAPERLPKFPGVSWENGAVHLLASEAGFRAPMFAQPPIHDGIIRASVRMSPELNGPGILMRASGTVTAGSSGYRFSLSSDRQSFSLYAIVAGEARVLKSWPLSRHYRRDDWLTLELRVVGDELTPAVNSQVLGTVRDASVPDAGGVQIYATNACFRDIEYVSLDAPASIASTTSASKAALQPAATPAPILLWRTAESVKGSTIRWQDGVLSCTQPKALIQYTGSDSRDAILRADVRMDPTADWPRLGLRFRTNRETQKGEFYSCSVDTKQSAVILGTTRGAKDGRSTALQTWRLRRTYAPGEWLHLEFRAIGDRFSVLVDGSLLGTILDPTQPVRGSVMLTDNLGNAAFRNVEYLPLDDAEPAVREAAAILPLWRTPESVSKDIRVQEGTLFIEKKAGFRMESATSRDAIFRAEVRMNPDAGSPWISLRAQVHPDSQTYDGYRLIVEPQRARLLLSSSRYGQAATLRHWPLSRSYGPDEWIHLELHAVGDRITVFADGKMVARVQDNLISEPGAAEIYATTNGYFRNVEYAPLDGSAAASLSAPAEPWEELLRDPVRLGLYGAMAWTPEGLLRATGYGGAVQQHRSRPPRQDGAIRLRATFGGVRPYLRARVDEAKGSYLLAVAADGSVVLLSRWSILTNQGTDLRSFILPKRLQPGQDYQLELRCVGQTLTAKCNGEILGTIRDGELREGYFQLAVIDPGPPTLIKSLEILDLDPPSTAPAAASAEAWEDALRDPTRFNLSGAMDRMPDGLLRSTGKGSASANPNRPPRRDGAIRLRTTFGGGRPILRARTDALGMYQLVITTDGKGVLLERWSNASNERTELRTFPLSVSVELGQEYQLELRCVGQTLTATCDGKIVGTLTDNEFHEGYFGFGVNSPAGAPTLIKSLELLNLDPPSSAGAPASSQPWQDALRDPKKLAFYDGAEWTLSGLHLTGRAFTSLRPILPQLENGAIRIRTTFGGVRPYLHVRNDEAKGTYKLAATHDGKAVTLERSNNVTQQTAVLRTFPLPVPLQPGQDYQLELRVVGQVFTAKCNEENLGAVTDSEFGKGYFAISVLNGDNGTPTLIKTVEILNLDPPAVK